MVKSIDIEIFTLFHCLFIKMIPLLTSLYCINTLNNDKLKNSCSENVAERITTIFNQVLTKIKENFELDFHKYFSIIFSFIQVSESLHSFLN